MNLALFFEGTGQGVHGKRTNVSRLYDATVESPRQLRHLESGSGTHFGAYLFGKAMGVDARAILARARRWFEANYCSLPPAFPQPPTPDSQLTTRVFLFGFSRGALLARHFAAWLDKLGVEVAYLGLWDTVDSTVRLDVSETCPPNVRRARHAVARDEHRRHFDYVPLKDKGKVKGGGGDGGGGVGGGGGVRRQVEEMLFPGSHSDVGGLYEDNHVIADAALAWIAEGARECGLEIVCPEEAKSAPSPAGHVRPKPVIHNSLRLVSNLFGLLGRIERRVEQLVRHPLCDTV